MGIHNNSPTFSYIKLDGITVAHGENIHTVRDFTTNLKYIYWNLDSPNQLTASNVMLNRTTSRYLIAINNKGECIIVPNETIIVSFDGNSVDSINTKIWGLYEDNEEFGKKFVSIEQDITGIRQTVGETEGDLGQLTEKVSKIEQSATEIDLSVKELNREYNENKEMLELRENVNKAIIDVNSAVGIFKSKMTEVMKGNKISEDEHVEIQAQKTILIERRDRVVEEVDKVIAIVGGQGHGDKVIQLTSEKTAFINAINNLITLIETSISDNIIVPSEVSVITDAFGKANVAINTLKNTLDEIIFLGTGGIISEELARIGIKSDEIVLSVSKVEESIKEESASLRKELTDEIQEVGKAVDGLEETMNNSFLDGVISDSEKIAIKHNLDTLLTEKVDIDNQYTTLYGNTNLTGNSKTELKTAYDSYIIKYNELVTTINTILSKEGNLDVNDQSQLNSALVAHRNALGKFALKANKAIDAISESRSNKIDQKYSEILLTPDGIVSRVGRVESTASNNRNRLNYAESEIEQLANKITSSVSEGDVRSIIEQSPDEIRYGFNDISDYVVINRNGLDVRRGSIACDSITSSSTNPIITLFDGNGMNCALDATANMNEGIGNAIRLKRDNSNYLVVGDGHIGIFLTGSNNNASMLATFTGGTSNFRIGSKGGSLELKNNVLYANNSRVSTQGHTHSGDEVYYDRTQAMTVGNVTTGNYPDNGSYMGGYIRTSGMVRADGGYIGMNYASTSTFKGIVETQATESVTPNVEYIGEGQVINGGCIINLPSAVVGMGTKYYIQITPIGNKNIYVNEKNEDNFIVHGDDCEFDYCIKVRLPRKPKRLQANNK